MTRPLNLGKVTVMSENLRYCHDCDGTGVVDLPIGDGATMFNCPTCTRWPKGFSGYGYMKADGTMHWFIKPYAALAN